MAYQFVVCFDRLTGAPVPASGPSRANAAACPPASAPELHALEAVLAVRDELAARVTVLALGLVSCCDPLREALYRGADEAVLVSDPRMTESDPLAAGYILSCALRKIGPDLVACAARTPDGDTASIGVQAAGRLGITPIASVDRPIAIDGGAIAARRDTGAGWELVNAVLPVLLTVTSAANTPRPPAMKRMMKYKKARSKGEIESASAGAAAGVERPPRADADRACRDLEAKGLLIRTWTLDDIGADPSKCGTAGSPTRIERIQSLVLAGGSSEVFENTDAGIARLVAALLKDHTI